MSARPPTSSDEPTLGVAGARCAQCGAELAPDQRYCLSCGLRRGPMRLPFAELVAADGARAAGAGPAPARSALAPLAALIALLLALGIGVLIGRGNGSDGAAQAPAQVVTVATPGSAAAPPAAAATPLTSDWPAATEGYTVQLQTLPATATADDVATAKQAATSKGASAVGALRSDEFPSLAPAQIVIYSGTFGERSRASSALEGLRASFPGAKVVRVARSAGSAGGAARATPPASTTPAPGSGSGLSTREYQRRSKSIPDEVQSRGAPPASDDKPAGGGSGDATEVG